MSKRDVVFSPGGVTSVSARAYSVEEVDDAGFHPSGAPKLRLNDDGGEGFYAEPANSSLVEQDCPVEHHWTPYLLFCSLSATIGSTFLFGFNAVVINEPYEIFQAFINQSYIDRHGSPMDPNDLDNTWTMTVSLFLVGGTIGALLGGAQANWLGRRLSLIIDSAIGLVAGVLMFTAPFLNMYELLMAGRALAGIHCGLVSAIVPGFLTELAPISLRGAAGTMGQLTLVTGGFTASILGLPVILARGNEPMVWPFLFFPCAILPAVQILLLFFSVESPRWLVMTKNDENAAFIAISRLRASHFQRNVIEAEVIALRREREIQDATEKVTFVGSLRAIKVWPLVICVVMQLAQQLSGINAVIYYSSSVFEAAGLQDPLPQYASLGIVGTTVLMTVVSIFVVEKAGRRLLMLLGLLGMLVTCLFLIIFMTYSPQIPILNYFTIVCMFIFVGAFSIGPGPIPWFIAPELSLPVYRPTAIAICTFVNWAANLATGFGFPPIEKAMGSLSFLPFFGLLTIFVFFTVFFLPETKGLSPEESLHRLELNKLQLRFPCLDGSRSARQPSASSSVL